MEEEVVRERVGHAGQAGDRRVPARDAMPLDGSDKILSLETLAERLRARRQEGHTIVHCHGCFDLMHIGHIKHLQAARRMGDTLIVTVTPDEHVGKGDGRPMFGQDLRAESLAALACVDFVAINRWATAAETIRLLRPRYYVKGQEFEGGVSHRPRLAAEIEALDEVGGQMRFTHEVVFSSSAILRMLRRE
jgi:rfaE bifunctional protein nucleotidyltransferase chain/domain